MNPGPAARLTVRPAEVEDDSWVEWFLESSVATRVARRGQLVKACHHLMLIAERDGVRAGLLTYVIIDDACEILTIHATEPWAGVGTALLDAVRRVARASACTRLWLVTTNDNVDALRFFQRRGFRIRKVRPGGVDKARVRLKPEIPLIGAHGIPIHDEIELETPIR